MAAGVLASSVGSVVGQYVLKESWAGDRAVRSTIVWGPAAATSLVLAPACALAGILGPPLLRLFLPQYVGTLEVLPILLVAAFLLHSQFGFSTTLIAIGRQLDVVPLCLGLSALNVAIDVVLVRLGWGIVGIATGTLVVNLLFAVGHMLLIARATALPLTRIGIQIGSLVLCASLPAAVGLGGSLQNAGPIARLGVVALAIVGVLAWVSLARVLRGWVEAESAMEPARRAETG